MVSLSCNKLHETLKATCKVVKMVSQNGVSSFEYQDNDKLLSATNTVSGTKFTVTYDDVGRVSEMKYYVPSDNSLKGYTRYNWVDNNNINADTYIYNANNEPFLDSKEKYELNDNDDPVKQKSYEKDDNGNWFVKSYNELIWNKGNIVRIETFYRDNETDEFQNIKTHLYEFDTKTNPWRNMSVRAVVNDFTGFPVSANNPVKDIEIINTTGHSVTLEYNYQYNSNDYPIAYTRVKTNTETGETLETYKVSKIEYSCN